ncbi:PAQR family membrane homeostasis protein TrhA [Desulfoplanes formicivorans]|uniref:Hemolysin III n=1 Tax=Desulfoplanes formicivorans TaxID=1592317 RepID=A0A194AI50_9BACT|nr:hemolysin III family protein [Desulfoplanes formicivorans]GAU08905.1 hemolysin III [Desulfoplanes formicivorans]
MDTSSLTLRYSLTEEIANSVIHGLGVLFSIAGLGVLTAFATAFGNGWHIVSVSIFGGTMIIMYTASTLYHGIPLPRVKMVLRVLDHSSIFLLIAGTYTPFTLVSLHGVWGWTLFVSIWCLAVAGIAIELSPFRKWRTLQIGLYLGMGWAVVVAAKPLLASVPPGGIKLLVAGGLCYTLGVIFYVWRSLKFNHAIWHLFVLAGTVFHFFAILLYVIPVCCN